ncbi:MAG: hypothetical protein C0392_05515 [Syntrophus sp. (in: bacteria)]|nr:hypothetical protein [Syntrophus sp. (in: bacteria)]
MKIGFHLSIAKGFEWTYREAQRLSCDVVQIFVKNPRSWAKKGWKDEDIDTFASLFADIPVFSHLSYLPNLARVDDDEKSMTGFMNEAALCCQIGIKAMVVHCGSHEDRKRGIVNVATAINKILDVQDLSIILENGAGQGNAIGTDITELAMIYDKVERKEQVSLCLDTAHLFQSGYDIGRLAGWNDLVLAIDREFGRDIINLFHLNDSKTGLNSRVDRHWHIGQGEIGIQAFKFILNEKRFAGLPGVMETPKTGTMDEINMKVMRSLLPPLMSRSFS